MDPRLLALDTSTERLALALTGPEGPRSLTEPGGARASARLIPAAQNLLHQAGLAFSSLDGIAFAAGPGAFTGLRTACAAAQGLALAIGKPVVALDSLMLVAEDAAPAAKVDSVVWVAMDARMDEVYAGAYRSTGKAWQVEVPPALYTLEALQQRLSERPPECVAGNAPAAFGGRWPVNGARPLGEGTDRGAALARLAVQQWQTAPRLDAAQAMPLYLRDKVALTTLERAQAAASAQTHRGQRG